MLLQDVGVAPAGNRLLIALEDRVRRALGVDRERVLADREVGAGGETHEVVRVRQGMRLVEVVDAPGEPALAVAPGAEVLDVEIADREDARRLRELGAGLRPDAAPAVERRTQERKGRLRHASVLEAEIARDQRRSLVRPRLVGARRFEDGHGSPRFEPAAHSGPALALVSSRVPDRIGF